MAGFVERLCGEEALARVVGRGVDQTRGCGQRGSFTEAVTGEDYAGMVSAMSGTLTQLSREIAAGIEE